MLEPKPIGRTYLGVIMEFLTSSPPPPHNFDLFSSLKEPFCPITLLKEEEAISASPVTPLEALRVTGTLEALPVMRTLEALPVMGTLEEWPVIGTLEALTVTLPETGTLETLPVMGTLAARPSTLETAAQDQTKGGNSSPKFNPPDTATLAALPVTATLATPPFPLEVVTLDNTRGALQLEILE